MANKIYYTNLDSIFEYVLLITIPKDVVEKIELVRKEIQEKYNIQQPETGIPAIALVRFTARETIENKITRQIEYIAAQEKPFKVHFKNFGSYPMHAIYINIENQYKILQLITKLKNIRLLMKASGESPHFMQDPQIMLVGRLANEQYIEVMQEYQNKEFTDSFNVHTLTLLKRSKQEKYFTLSKHFLFANNKKTTTQTSLFKQC